MNRLVTIAALLLCSCTTDLGLRLDNSSIPPDVDASSQYVGTATIDGLYQIVEDGEVCFIPTQRVIGEASLPKDARICFSNDDDATKLLGIAAKVGGIDAERVCGVQGQARIVISGLWIGHGPATDWYTTKLLSVVSKEPASQISCGG